MHVLLNVSFFYGVYGRDPFNQNSDRSDREKRTTSKGGPVFSKLFQLDRTDPLSFGPKFPETLVEWIAPYMTKYILEVVVADQCSVFFGAKRYIYLEELRVICHTTLSFNPLNQFPQSQCEYYASIKSF